MAQRRIESEGAARDSAIDRQQLVSRYREHVAHLEQAYGRILAGAGLDAVVLHAGTPKPRSEFDDQFWPLRPTPHFQHWLPLGHPDCALIIEAGRRPRLVWPRARSFWETPAEPDSDHWQAAFDIVEVGEPAEVKLKLPAGRVAFIGEDRQRAAEWGLDTSINPLELVSALDALRTRKTSYEVMCLAEANRRAAAGHRRVAQAFFAGGASELDLHLLYLSATGQDDPETPYKNIVALGASASTLHHISYRREPEARADGSLLLDAGAACHGYASDVTRSYVKGPSEAASLFGGLVDRLEQMQQRLCLEARIGLPYEQLHDRAHQEAAAILTELGIARVSVEEAVASGLSRIFFPHGLGHSLGLQTHDVGCAEVKPRADNPFLRNTSVIAEGQVFTIEPGLYFIDLLLELLRQGPESGRVDWKRVDALRPFGGARIEDDLHITSAGPVNLTRAYV